MKGLGFLSTCKKRAAEELEEELQEAELFGDGNGAEETGAANSLRKQAVAWLTGAMPWGSKEPELEKKQSRRVFVNSTSHADDLEEVLLNFDVAYDRLWNVMTDINTDLMLFQGLQSSEVESPGLMRSLRAVDESHVQYSILTQAASVLSKIREADLESYRSLGVFHQELERLLSCEVWCSQEAVVALEKARTRMEVASTRLNSMRRSKDKKKTAAAQAQFDVSSEAYEDQAAVVEELLPEVVGKIEGAIASGLANFLRAQHRRFRAGCCALEGIDFSLPTLDTAAETGFAAAAKRRLFSKRRVMAALDGRGSSLHRLLTSPAGNFAVATALAEAAADDDAQAMGALARLLDDVDTCVPMTRALLRSQVLRHDPEAVDANFAAAFVSVSGRVCRRLLVASVKVSCQDKKGSRYGPHALEQAMSVMCGGCGPEFVADLEASHPTDASKALFRNNCLGFCRAIVDAPLESCPGVLRSVACYVREQLALRGVSSQLQQNTLYSVFALCYVCPALRDPAAFGIAGFPQPFSASGRDLMRVVASGLERELGLNEKEKRSSSSQLSPDVAVVLEEMRKVLKEFCLQVLSETRELGAPSSGASSAQQPMSGQSLASGASFEEPVMSAEVAKDLAYVANVAMAKLDTLKDLLERRGHQALALAFEEELNRKEFLKIEEPPTKKKLPVKSGRVCTLPGLARIKGGKGRLFGLKYRELRSDEEASNEEAASDEDVQLSSHFPSMAPRASQGSAGGITGNLDDEQIGVGVQFALDPQGYLRVKHIAPGGSAERCGMMDVGDILVDVSGQNIYVHDDPLTALRGMVYGKVGTVVEFGLQKPGSGQVKRVKLRRAERYGSDAKNDANVGPGPLSNTGNQVSPPHSNPRPRVRVRTTFTKGQSEHSRPRGEVEQGEAEQGMLARTHAYVSAPRGPRLEADTITSTGSVGSEKFELSGVGVTLKIGEDDMFYVHDILAGGPAERNGCLSHGDYLMAINDVILQGKRFDECAKILNGSMGTVANLDLISLGDFGSSDPQVKRITLRRTWVPDIVWNAACDDAAPRQEEGGDNVSDQNTKQALVPHGVGITFTKTQNDSTFSVKRITEGGPADLAGTIKTGDIIKTVDGVSVERKSYRHFARMILGPLGSIVQLGIERGADREQHLIQLERGPAATNILSEPSSEAMSTGEGDDEPPNPMLVHKSVASVQRSGGPAPQTLVSGKVEPVPAEIAGVGLKCDQLGDGSFYVTGVQHGGPAACSGTIVVGDQVCAVGGVNLKGKSKSDLRDMIMGPIGSFVTLQIFHTNGSFDDVKLARGIAATSNQTPSLDVNDSGLGDLGMHIERIQGGQLRVCEIQSGGGAFQSQNIRKGDIITVIDGVRVVHLDMQTVQGLMCGVPGTKVNLSIRTADGADRSVEVTRTSSKGFKADGGKQCEEEKSFDGGSENGDDDMDSQSGSRGRMTGLGMSFRSNDTGMIIVRRVKEGGPAERLGIREGDTIVALDGQHLQNMYTDKKELSRLMLGYAGSKVKVALQRKGHTKIEPVVLTRGRSSEERGESTSRMMAPLAHEGSWMSDKSMSSGSKVGLGLTFVKPDGQPGVVVKRVKEGGAAAATGKLSPGDRVMQIDGQELLQVTSKVLTNFVMGHEGSIANLKVRKSDGTIEYVSVTRGSVNDPYAPSMHSQLQSEPSLDFSVYGESRRERCGLGITFKKRDGSRGMVINRIKDNGPAVGIGVEPGDRLLAVDGIYLDSLSTPELTKILLGAGGTQVRLEIAKADGRTIQLVLYRGECGLGLHAENSRESVTSSVESVSSDMSSDQEYLMGVGLTFHRPDGLGGVVVKKVKENGVAAADGRISPGDRLLSVDGKSLGEKISNEDLMRMVLGEPGSSVRLQIQYQNGQSEEVDLIRALELQGSDNLDCSSAGRCSQLCSLGVTFFPPTDDHQVVIKRLKEGGAAQVSGKIMAGDRLIEIDGRQVHKLSGSELKALLMGFPGSCCQVRVQHQNGTSEYVNLVRIAEEDGEEQPMLVQKKETARAQRSAGPRPQTLSISSEKSLDEISFSAAACKMERKRRVGLGVILSEHDGGEGFLIKKVKAGTASALSGKVFAADRLLSIDGTSLTGLEQSEIEKLVVRPAGSTSVCVLRRKDGSLDHVMLCRPEQSLQSEECATAVSEDEDEDHVSDEPERPVGLGMVFLRPDGKGGRIVKRKKEGSAADAHDNILPGDRCLTIDGNAIENLTDRELSDLNRGMIGSTAIVMLRSKSGIDKECVLKRCKPIFENIVEGCGSELSYDSSIASGLTSSDTSGRSGLGLTFHEWAAGTGGLRVKRVKKGGAADNSAQIHPGDVIQKIDGIPLDNIESRALLKLLMGPEGSIVVVNLINGQGIAMQVILTRAPRGGHAEYEQESSLSPSKNEGMSASKQVSVVRSPPEVAMSPKVLATTPVSPPSFVADKSSPPSQTPMSLSPKVLTAKPVPSPPTFPTAQSPPPPPTLVTANPMLSPPAISTRQSSPPSQTPKVIPVSSLSPPTAVASSQQDPLSHQIAKPAVKAATRQAPPLPPPAKKPDVVHAPKAAELAPPSDFKPLLMGMSAAFAQESMPDDGVDDDAALGSAYHNTRDDLSEVSMDDSVLGDGDEEGGRRQCGLGMTFRNPDGKGGVVVKRVKVGGGAELSGEIEPGDRVLRLDGKPLDSVSQADLASMTIGDEGTEALLEVVKACTGQEVMISVARIRSGRGLSFADKEVREYSLLSGELSCESSREDLGEEGDLGEECDLTVKKVLPRIARTGLGLTFKPPDGQEGVVVKRVKEDGAAFGMVQDGDRIISIDDWPLTGISNSDLIRLSLGIPGSEAVLKITRPGVGEIPDVTILRPEPAPKPETPQSAPARATPSLSLSEDSSESIGSQVSISSISSSLASQLVGTAGSGKAFGLGLTFRPKSQVNGVVVKRVKEDGAAALEGSIAPGDVVVTIDGTLMSGLDQMAQANLMMGAEGSKAELGVIKSGSGRQIKVILSRSRPSAHSLAAEDSSESISSISSEVSTSSSIVSPVEISSNPGEKALGIGLTFLKVDKASGGLPVNRVKDDGAAAGSSIKPGDIVLSIDGVALGALDTKHLSKVMMGAAGTAARLQVLKRNGQQETVVLYRGAGGSSLSERSTDSVGSESLSSEVSFSSTSCSSVAREGDGDKLGGIGLTFLKGDKASGGLPVKRIKEDGGAVNTGICPGDIVLSIDGVGPLATLDSKALTAAMLGASGSVAKLQVLKKVGGHTEIVEITRGGGGGSILPIVVKYEEAASCVQRESSNESIGSQVSISSTASLGDKSAGIGLTFLSGDKAAGGLPVKRIKEDGGAVNTGICPGDIVLSIDGVGQLATLDSKKLTAVMMGAHGSVAKVEVLKKVSGQKEVVFITRGTPSLAQGSTDSIGSVSSVASVSADVSTSNASSPSSSGKVALGFTYKASKADGQWRVSTIKGGWALQSGMLKTGDVMVSVQGKQCKGLDLQALTLLLQGPENTVVKIEVERDGARFSAEGKRIRT